MSAGKSVRITVRKPAKNGLDGEIVHSNLNILHQNQFNGESRHELEPKNKQLDTQIIKPQETGLPQNEAARFLVV
jgi:hypothetical protein